ncbi:MAG: nucleotidyltransferase family protein [Acidobacteriota bacterium]
MLGAPSPRIQPALEKPANRSTTLLELLASPSPEPAALRHALRCLPGAEVPRLLERIRLHRIDGLAHRVLSRLPRGAADPWLRSTLKRRHQRIAAATLSQALALAELLDAFRSARVPVVVMRGLRCVEAVYGDAGARPFDDHDLLIPRASVGSAHAVLERQGFRERARGLYRRGGVLVDLHTDALGARRRPTRLAAFPVWTEVLLARAVPGVVAGAPASILPLEDELLLLAIHVVKHSFDRLIRVADLAHLIASRASSIDWEALRRRCEATRTDKLLGWALEAAALLGAPSPPELRAEGGAGRLERALMRRALAWRPVPYTGEILMALAIPSRARRLAFLLDALVPGGEVPDGLRRRTAFVSGRTVALMRDGVRHIASRGGGR